MPPSARPLIVAFTVLSAVLPAPLAGAGDALQEPRRFVLEIRERAVQREEPVLRVTRGDTVELTWTSDERADLHLHGYDLEFEVRPGAPTTIEFEAHATGRYPVTSHGFGDDDYGHHTLLYLEVHPD